MLFRSKTVTDSEVEKLVHHTSFNTMRKNPATNYEHMFEDGTRERGATPFFRNGQVGDWRRHFSTEANAEFDAWIEKHNSTGYPFVFE